MKEFKLENIHYIYKGIFENLCEKYIEKKTCLKNNDKSEINNKKIKQKEKLILKF